MAHNTVEDQMFCSDCLTLHVQNPSMSMFSKDVPPRLSKQPIEVFGLKLLFPAMDVYGFNKIAPRTPEQICPKLVQDLIFKYFAPSHHHKRTGNVNRLIVFSSDAALLKKPFLPLWQAAQKYLKYQKFDEVAYKAYKGYNVPAFILNPEEPEALVAMDYFLRVAEWAFLAAPEVSHYPWNPAPEPMPTFEYTKDGIEEIARPTPIKIECCVNTIDNNVDIKTVT